MEIVKYRYDSAEQMYGAGYQHIQLNVIGITRTDRNERIPHRFIHLSMIRLLLLLLLLGIA